jgi:hypothetical protein
MKKFIGVLVVLFVVGLASMAYAVANTVTTSTGVKSGTDPTFAVTYRANASQGVILYLKYTKGGETGITLTFDKIVPSLSATDLYRHATLSGTALSAYTMVITASGNYRIPLPVIPAESKVIVNIVYGSANQGGALVANFLEP